MSAHRFFALILAFSVATPCATAGSYHSPHNGYGQADFEGLWSSNWLTKLERPDVYPSVVISEAQARAVRPPALIPPDPTGQAESETYDPGLALARVGPEIRTAWIVDPPDGRLPFTPEGRARAQKANDFDDPETRTNQERCLLSPGTGPPLTNSLYNNNLQIVQTRDNLVMLMETMHEARIVRIVAKRPVDHHEVRVRRWMGDSVGWWEGDVFVMETTGFTPTQSPRSSPIGRLFLSPDAVITERLQRTSPTQILYKYTVVDPANYTSPWRGEMPLKATNGPIYEYACHEGNYSLPNILAGARHEEAARRASR